MKQTEIYQLNLIEGTDALLPDPINANTQAIEGALAQLAASAAKVAAGTYVGDGTYGAANPNQLTFPFQPKAVLLFNAAGRIGEEGTCMVLLQGRTTAAAYNSKGSTVVWTDTGVSWYTDGTIPHYQMNVKNTPYFYLAVG